MNEFIILTFGIAGFVILLRTWLSNHPQIQEKLKEKAPFLHKLVKCGVCVTYWTTFFSLLLFTLPLNISVGTRPFLPVWFEDGINFFVLWMAIGFCATFLRYAFLVVLEKLRQQLGFNKN